MELEKTAVSVTEMAKELGFSRSRMYQLINIGAMPAPMYSIETRRPYYDQELQTSCREVRRKNCGIDGKPILFYSARRSPTPAKKVKQPKSNFAELIEQLADLGISTSNDKVEAAVRSCFPTGTAEVQPANLIRTLFIHLKRQN